MASKQRNRLATTKQQQTHKYGEEASSCQWQGGGNLGEGSERYKLLGVQQAQGCTVHLGEYSQYYVTIVNGRIL